MCITGSFFKQIKLKHQNFVRRGDQDKKEIPQMCTIGGHLKVLKHAHMKANLQF